MRSMGNMMKRGTMAAFVGTAAIAASLVAATPASADTVGPFQCGGEAGASGSTEGDAQITYVGTLWGDCGTLGIRVQYTHVGGSSWTGWKYESYWDNVTMNVRTANKSQHTTTYGNLNFYSTL